MGLECSVVRLLTRDVSQLGPFNSKNTLSNCILYPHFTLIKHMWLFQLKYGVWFETSPLWLNITPCSIYLHVWRLEAQNMAEGTGIWSGPISLFIAFRTELQWGHVTWLTSDTCSTWTRTRSIDAYRNLFPLYPIYYPCILPSSQNF